MSLRELREVAGGEEYERENVNFKVALMEDGCTMLVIRIGEPFTVRPEVAKEIEVMVAVALRALLPD